MQIALTGVILFTQQPAACVHFYREVLGLPLAFEKPGLTALHFGGAYLMLEAGGCHHGRPKTVAENPTILRFNVPCVDTAAQELRAKGVDVHIHHFDWGTIGQFFDPDGHCCQLKSQDADFAGFSAANAKG